MFQILRQEVNQGITYSYTIPATKSKSSSSISEELRPKHIPLPSLPSEEEDITEGATAPSDQAASAQQQYNSFKPELRTQNQDPGQTNSNSQYSKTQDSRITNSDTIYYQRRSQNVGNAYTNSQFTVPNTRNSYAVNPFTNQRGSEGVRHRIRHHKNRHSRSHRHQVVVQSSPERRYDLQPNSGSQRTSNVQQNPNQPHIISALTPEGQRRYQYASQQSQSGVYPNRGGYLYQGQYIQPVDGQAGYNPNLGVQGPPLNGQQYHSYYQTSSSRGRYTDPITLGRAPLNDQISLNLPDSRTQQIGNVDIVNDYSWRISGFTECSHTCGGGK